MDCWQLALKSLGWQDQEEVIMIEFESQTKMTKHKTGSLNGLNISSRGGTSMAGVVDKLSLCISENSNKSLNIWIISDGAISDQREFKNQMMKTLQSKLSSPNISVVGVRLMSDYSDPETLAMCAVGLLSAGDFKLQDVHSGYRNYDSKREHT